MRASVGIEARADGAGQVRATVRLDHDAASRAGDLKVDDLRRAGWVVVGPRAAPGGAVEVTATHGFRTPAEATAVMGQLGEPFRGFHLTRTRSFLRTRTRLTGEVDLTSVPGVTDLAAVERAAGPLADAVHVDVTARLPGAVKVWRPQLGQRMQLAVSAVQWNLRAIALAALSVLAFFGFVYRTQRIARRSVDKTRS